MKAILILLFFIANTLLFAVHNFTINGQKELQVSIGDNLQMDFDYEVQGNYATMEILIYVSTFDFPTITPENVKLSDGGSMDQTGIDGHFSYNFENFFCLPQTSTLTIKLTDNNITDEVRINFVQLDSDYFISGKILKEQEHISSPVRGAFVYSFYNADRNELHSLFENPSAEDFMNYMQEDRYFISVLSNSSGDYQIFVPDEETNIDCTVDVISGLDTNNEKVAPETKEICINGGVSGINLIYQNPDGYFSGTITNEAGDSLRNCTLIIKNADSTRTYFVFSDSLGTFNIPLLNDWYSIKITKIGYQEYTENFIIENNDYNENIVLFEEINHLDSPDISVEINNDSLKIYWNAVANAEYYSVYTSPNPFLSSIFWETVVDSTTDLFWKSAITEDKRFYFIKAKRN